MWILGVILRQLREVLALSQARLQHLDLLACLVVVLRLVVLQVAHVRVGPAGYQNLRDVDLRFHQIEACFVRVVVIGHVLVRDVDIGGDLFIEELGDTQIAAQLGLQIVEGDFAQVKLLLELIGGKRSLNFGYLGIHFAVSSHQAQLFSAL